MRTIHAHLQHATSVILCAIVAAIMTSCIQKDPGAAHAEWQEQHDKYCAQHITKFNYEGHSYLMFRGGKYDTIGITHDENCLCRYHLYSGDSALAITSRKSIPHKSMRP